MTLAIEAERGAANLYAKQVAHWIEKHDALLAQQLETGAVEKLTAERDAYAAAADSMAAAHKVERDALRDAARLALDFVEFCWRDVTLNEFAEEKRAATEAALKAVL